MTRLCKESDAVDWTTDMLGKKVEVENDETCSFG